MSRRSPRRPCAAEQLADRLAVGLAAARLPRRGAARPARAAPVRVAPAAGAGRAARCARVVGPAGVHPAGGAPGRLRRDLRHPAPLQPLPDLLRPRRHPQARDGAAAVQADLPAVGRSSSTTPSCPTTSASCWSTPPPSTSERGRQLMLDHRAGLELLRLSLRERDSPWAGRRRRGHRDAAAAARRRAGRRTPPRRRGPARGGGRARAVRRPDLQPRRGHAVRPDHAAHADLPGSPPMNEFLFVVVPYICLTTFVVGHVWRYRYDKFGWTTRSSQLYENRLLRIGSPLFHFGIIGVVPRPRDRAGHPEVVDRGGRDLRGALPLPGGLGRRAGRPGHRRRDGHPDLPPAHRRAGLLGDHPDGQGDVPLPRHRDPARPLQHGRGQHRRRTTTTARASRSGSAGSSASTCTPA